MPTTILDHETYQGALQRRYAEEAKVEERMTTKLKQAARQALEACIRNQPAKAQEILEQALEQPEQEPVADVFEAKKTAFADCKQKVKAPDDVWTVSDGINFFGFFSHGWEYAKKYYTAPQPDINLNCPSVQKRLATSWGYVKAGPAAADHLAASGKPIAEQTNTQFMEGYRIGLAEMREKCAKVVTEHAPTCSPHWVSYVVAIRAIKFEGDTGFRPVSEMVAEHKQDPKKAAAIEKAKMRKAEQEPVVMDESWCLEPQPVNGLLSDEPVQPVKQEPVACNCGTNPWHDCNESEGCRIKKSLGISSRPVSDQRADHHKMMLGYEIATKYGVFENKAFQLCDEMKKLYTAPVRTKDLTDIEYLQDAVTKALKKAFHLGQTYWQQADSESYAANKKADVTQELFFKLKDDTRAVIAADREKNKC